MCLLQKLWQERVEGALFLVTISIILCRYYCIVKIILRASSLWTFTAVG